VFLDATLGHIVIDDDAVVRPGAIICGPAYIGPHSHVLDRCLIKPNTVIGPHCKVAGEIGGTIFQGFANKAHDGHLGDSYIGEWANLGAGTTNSNLLNTYGEVIAKAFGPDGKPGSNERTGEQFLGAIIGDHGKFAICTRIMTGAIVGTGTMWAATAPVTGTVPRFSWVTDAGVKPFAMAKFIEVARAVMGRRKVAMSAAYIARLTELHRRDTTMA
jgi:UDP-N-acetylglucosamine diphosphorylase/glucosamine-1-phosphate N-acetyltransferase